MACHGMHFNINLDYEGYNKSRDNYKGKWPHKGNYIHEYYVVSSIAERNYALNPPVIHMHLSFDGVWYPKELSDPNYKHVNYFKP